MKRKLYRAVLLGALGAAACTPTEPEPARTGPDDEVRALWVVRYTLAHPDSIRAMVRRADEAGFNTLIVQVRGRGDAFYAGGLEPRADALAGTSPAFDPLALVLQEAHARGLSVHAWLNTHLVANMDALPKAEDHVVYRHPESLAVPRALARDLYGMDPRDPLYLEALAAFAREHRDRVEGLYTAPASPEVQEHIYAIWMDLLERYDLDGMHFDYVRYAAPDFDYSRTALERFRSWLEPQLDSATRQRYAALAEADPLAHADSFPAQWDRFRREQVTALVERIHQGVKQRKPDVLVSAAVFGDAEDAYRSRFQDWREWLRQGFLDVVCPMAYTPDTGLFTRQIRTAVETAGGRRVWAGIGAWRIPVESTVEKIEAARSLGTGGIVLFSYDAAVRPSEVNPRGDYLIRVRDRAFGRGGAVATVLP